MSMCKELFARKLRPTNHALFSMHVGLCAGLALLRQETRMNNTRLNFCVWVQTPWNSVISYEVIRVQSPVSPHSSNGDRAPHTMERPHDRGARAPVLPQKETFAPYLFEMIVLPPGSAYVPVL